VKNPHQLAGLKGGHERLRAARRIDHIHRVWNPVTLADEPEECSEGIEGAPLRFWAALDGRQELLNRLRPTRKGRATLCERPKPALIPFDSPRAKVGRNPAGDKLADCLLCPHGGTSLE